MFERDIEPLPEAFDRSLGLPFGGVLGDSVMVRVVNQVVTDPYSAYTTSTLAALAGASVPSVRDALNDLVANGFLLKDPTNARRPLYRVNASSKRLIALTLLSYSVLDDDFLSSHFNNAILDYIGGEARPRRGYSVMVYNVRSEATIGQSTNAAMMISNTEPSGALAAPGWSVVFASNMVQRATPLSLTVSTKT